MPIPFIFPIAGFLVTGAGLSMIVHYVQADKAHRTMLDTWLTEALKAALRTYLRMRYGINLGSLTSTEEKEYWNEFGLRLQAFLDVAEPIAFEMFGKSFADLTQSEQAKVVRRIARDKNEGAE